MIRKAFRMSVHEDRVEEYVQRHNPIWEELETVFEAHDVHIYSIFLDPDDSPQSTDLKEVFHLD